MASSANRYISGWRLPVDSAITDFKGLFSMKKLIILSLAAVLVSACAIREKPVLEIQNAPLSVAGGEADVAAAIKSTLTLRGWQVIDEQPGEMTARFAKANSDVGMHSVTIDITYDADSYSIAYVDSENMMYDAPTHTIHRNYNRWVVNLQRDLSIVE